MTIELTISLPIGKVRQHLLKYFETRKDVKVKGIEPNSVRIRASGWRPPPWLNIKIGLFGEGDRTRLGFNFDFRLAYVVMTLAIVMGIAVLWGITLIRPESVGYAIGFTIGILVTIPIGFALEISEAKKKFLTDIRNSIVEGNE